MGVHGPHGASGDGWRVNCGVSLGAGWSARASNVSGYVYLYRSNAILLYFSHICAFVCVYAVFVDCVPLTTYLCIAYTKFELATICVAIQRGLEALA